MLKLFLFILISNITWANIHLGPFEAHVVGKNIVQNIEFKNRKKPLVAIFISKDCPCSKGNLSYINSLSREFPDFDFIGIHSKRGTSDNEVREYLSDKKMNFDVLLDSDMKIATQFEALKTPHAYIVMPNGDVAYNGGITNTTFPENAKEYYLKNALSEIKNNRKVTKSETRTLGCFIVR